MAQACKLGWKFVQATEAVTDDILSRVIALADKNDFQVMFSPQRSTALHTAQPRARH